MRKRVNFRRIRRRVLFHLLRLFAVALSLTGFKHLKTAGRALGEWQFRLGRARRRHVQNLIPPALGEPVDACAILNTAYRENTRAVLEVLALYSRRLPDTVIKSACEIEGLAHLDALDSGAILLGTHSGNGVLLPVRLARMGYPVGVAMREAGKIAPGFFSTGLARYGVEAMDANAGNTGLKAMIRALRGGGLLYILVDQGSKRDAVTTQFLGRQMRIPAGPAVLARRCAVPIIPAPTIAADPVWRFRLDVPVVLERNGGKEQDTRYMACLSEHQIRVHPELWTWHHRRWGRK